MTRRFLPTIALLLLACGQQHTQDAGAGVDAAEPPPVCDPPSATVLVQSDYAPGAEVVSIVLERNDMVVDGTGVTEDTDLVGGVELGPLCELTPGTRITVRLVDGRGGDIDAMLMTPGDVTDGSTLTFVLERG